MSLLARTPHGSIREGVPGLAARRDGSGRDFYALGPIAVQIASVTQALVSILRAARHSAKTRPSVRCGGG
jgi:hypothetical protein